ncbi:MAG TPA: chromosome segregation protein SMC, partial [Candidatus Hydrogenedentes bacterium]|nr:chromosome segregation protein SMC [Candidatus Hydrogenedentota bacterium]
QDVIFNGSSGRPPTGMAEVSLLFDNTDGQLPVDFSEVEITRRVFRSGESEYLMNKAACRLRDVQELFMDTGIGTNAYSLIGQGKIDLILSTKPEDRRYLLEEAAGIIKYKSRKRVAMRKLESAEQNMMRLNDIIGEVDRQMRSLKRQVNAAIRHREYSRELRLLEIRNAWLQYNELTGQVSDLQERLKNAVDQYQELTTKTSRQEAELETINLKRMEIEKTLSERREKEHDIATEMEKIEGKIALLNKEIEFANTRREEALQTREEMVRQAETMEGEAGAADKQSAVLAAEVEACTASLASRQAEQEQAAQRLAEAEAFVEQLRGMTLESVNTWNRAQTEAETITVNIANLQAQLAAAAEERASLEERLRAAQERVDATRILQAEQHKRLGAIADKREAAKQESDRITAENASFNREWQELRERKSSEEARLNSLIELRDSYEGFAVGVRAVMLAKQKELPGFDGIIGPVGDLISTEKRFEYAIEAALGGNINNVICEQADAAKAAIAFLKEHRAGRVTFLPLDTIRAARHDDDSALSGQSGVVGQAIEYVQCDSHLLPAVQYLLYNTLIVETIDDAIRIARIEKRFPRLVTLDGEVVTSAGAVTGGRTQHESHGLLGRTAEIEDLEKSVTHTAQRITKTTTRMKSLAEKSEKITAILRELDQEADSIRQGIAEIGVTTARHTAEMDNLRSSLASLQERSNALEIQREGLETQLADAQSRIGNMADDDESLQRKLREATEASASARETLATLNAQVSDLRVKQAESVHALEELRRSLERTGRARNDMLEQAEKQQQIAVEMAARAAAFEKQVKDAIRQSHELSKTHGETHKTVLEANKEQQFIIESIEQLTKLLKESREKRDLAQKEVHKLELDCSQKESRIQNYQERISDEYGLSLASLTEAEVGMDEHDEEEREKLIHHYRDALQKLGNVNLGAIEEYESLEKRSLFLKTQNDDLVKARDTLLHVVKRIDTTTQDMFLQTFTEISENFKNYFRRLFNGGQARLFLMDESNPLECGIEIEARPPGKKPQTISLLSGGEQAMTAIALLFSIFAAKPSPFCVLDEVDAPLDDANIGRFLAVVDEFTEKSQFIMITHNKQTMAHAGALFGVTQQEAGVSQLVSVRLEEAEKVVSGEQ